jgi:inositol transport system substrate-binding protein
VIIIRCLNKIKICVVIMGLINLISGCASQSQVEKPKQEVIAIKTEDTKKDEPLRKEKQIVIGASLLDFKNEFIMNLRDAMEKEAKKLDVSLVVSDGQNSAEKQISQVENFIAKKVDVIIINPTSFDNCKSAVEAANKANIPILTVNTLVANQNKCATFVGSDAVESGKLQMEYAAKLLNWKGNIVILRGQNGHDAEIGRRKGTQEILNKYKDIKVLYEQSGNWTRAEGMAIIENLVQSGKQIDAVVSQNDEMALGAIKALEDDGSLNKTLVFGIDAIPEALKAMKEGKMAGTVFQDATGQGVGAIDAAVKISKGEKIESEIFIPYMLVTKENLQKFFK